MKKLLTAIGITTVIVLMFYVAHEIFTLKRNSSMRKFESLLNVPFPKNEEDHLLRMSQVKISLDTMKASAEQLQKEVSEQLEAIKSFPKLDINDTKERVRRMDIVRAYQANREKLSIANERYRNAVYAAYRAGFKDEAVAHGYQPEGGGDIF